VKGSLKKLIDFLNRPPHIYETSTQTFLALNVEKLKNEMRLAERGRECGARGEPDQNSTAMDEVEQSIVTAIEAEAKKNAHIFDNNMLTYAERLHGLGLEGYRSDIQIPALGAITEFKAQVHQGRDQLYQLRRDVIEVEREFNLFKQKNRLEKTAHYPESRILHWAIIAALLLVESVANGVLLAKGHEFGIVGGVGVAVLIAFVNVAILGIVLGAPLLRLAFHRHWALKTIGILGTAAYLAIAAGLNLAVAHYRDALAGPSPEQAEHLAIETLMTNPFGITELQSGLMLIVGFAFSVIAALDRLAMDDRYPGYGKVDRKRKLTVQDYVSEKEQLLGELAETREEYVELMRLAKEDLRKRRGEHFSILEGRARMQQTYQSHLHYLQDAANELLSVYRDANRAARDSAAAPPRFSESWKMAMPAEGEPDTRHLMSREQIDAIVTETAQVLDQYIKDVHEAYSGAVTQYNRIDELTEQELARGP